MLAVSRFFLVVHVPVIQILSVALHVPSMYVMTTFLSLIALRVLTLEVTYGIKVDFVVKMYAQYLRPPPQLVPPQQLQSRTLGDAAFQRMWDQVPTLAWICLKQIALYLAE